jgi:SAM-dependent methyltransferase
MEFNAKQMEQEDDYHSPNHWFKEPDSEKGRIYYGYLSICEEIASEGDKDAAILDAGCGDAFFLGMLEKSGFTNLSGTDYSRRAIAFARLLVPSAHFEVADLAKLPYADASFDAVFCIETVEHLIPETIDGVMCEFKRVLKPGGRLVITVPALNGNGPPSAESKHYQHFTVESLSKYLTPHFEVKKMMGQDKVGFHPLKFFYKAIKNGLWEIPRLRTYYNLKIWPRYFNQCDAEKGRRLVAVCRKV